ncbi:hypothetical protein NBH00_21395 [Paraconexibacter antarcticus]|uniref:Uncharacterized protein n=1 Tax=Paraconexibacter antarcticus TaxID=2949664 RepID=A0ABY5DSG3_9ACTN|nr:hypothetical protein [Paraconexibacter antarcticus]UTI63886.1 hypothetical protein NBH00_21395 [Paraconexibacter antarcticus]
MLAAGRLQRRPQGRQLLVIQSRLDPPEEGALLMADVVAQHLTEARESRDLGGALRLQLIDPASDVGVLGEDPVDVRVLPADVSRERRQQQFLLQPEMLASFVTPESERADPELGRVRLRGSLEA